MNLYLTFCSDKKFPLKKAIPKNLYDSRRIVSFITRCETVRARYALLSGKYGVVFDDEVVVTYNQFLGNVSPNEYKMLVEITRKKLRGFALFFYEPNPHRAKSYHRLLVDAKLKFTPFNRVAFILENEKKQRAGTEI